MLYGTKIIVVDSNVQRKSGPRRGSLGFVLSTSPQFFTDDHAYTQRNIDVAFFRYGFEHKPRCELREIRVITGITKDIQGQLPKNTINSMINCAKKCQKQYDTAVLVPLSEKTGSIAAIELKAFLICCLNAPENNIILSSLIGEDITNGKNISKIKPLLVTGCKLYLMALFNRPIAKQLADIDVFYARNPQQVGNLVSFFTKLRSIQICSGLVRRNTGITPTDAVLSLKGKSIYNSNK